MKQDKLIMGIDEAGRGPVIGSLFIAAALINESKLKELDKHDIKDSKLLLPKKREHLFKILQRILLKYKILEVKPDEIDHAVNGHDGLNLNWLEARKTTLLINEFNPDIVYIDCPSPNINAYKDYLLNYIKSKNVQLIIEHKADVKYKICSAASILAKVSRDSHIKELEKKYGTIGPGYQSNSITQKFIKENFDKYPEIFRKSWLTFKNHVNAKKQKNLDEF